MLIIISRDATFILFKDFNLVGEVPVCKQKVLKKCWQLIIRIS